MYNYADDDRCTCDKKATTEYILELEAKLAEAEAHIAELERERDEYRMKWLDLRQFG